MIQCLVSLYFVRPHSIFYAVLRGVVKNDQHDPQNQLMGFALKSRPSLMISVAEYLEEKGELEKAVQLYQKAGEVTKALDLCFRAGAGEGQQDREGGGDKNPAMFEALKSMMDDLGSHASPQVRFIPHRLRRWILLMHFRSSTAMEGGHSPKDWR